jgi:hypothetical protein
VLNQERTAPITKSLSRALTGTNADAAQLREVSGEFPPDWEAVVASVR